MGLKSNWKHPVERLDQKFCEVLQVSLRVLLGHADFPMRILVSISLLLPRASLATHQSENE